MCRRHIQMYILERKYTLIKIHQHRFVGSRRQWISIAPSVRLVQCLITNASQPAMGRGVSPGARMATTTIWPSGHQTDLIRVRGPGRVCVLASDSSQIQYAYLWEAKPKDPWGEDIQGKITLVILLHWKMWVPQGSLKQLQFGKLKRKLFKIFDIIKWDDCYFCWIAYLLQLFSLFK